MIIRRSKRQKKILSIRSKFGRKAKHELLLFRSSKNIYGYVVDLLSMKVLFGLSTLSLVKENIKFTKGGKLLPSRAVGEKIGEKCKSIGVVPVINTAEYKYHGRVKALVEGFKEKVSS